jgi:hypothetical protein
MASLLHMEVVLKLTILSMTIVTSNFRIGIHSKGSDFLCNNTGRRALLNIIRGDRYILNMIKQGRHVIILICLKNDALAKKIRILNRNKVQVEKVKLL